MKLQKSIDEMLSIENLENTQPVDVLANIESTVNKYIIDSVVDKLPELFFRNPKSALSYLGLTHAGMTISIDDPRKFERKLLKISIINGQPIDLDLLTTFETHYDKGSSHRGPIRSILENVKNSDDYREKREIADLLNEDHGTKRSYDSRLTSFSYDSDDETYPEREYYGVSLKNGWYLKNCFDPTKECYQYTLTMTPEEAADYLKSKGVTVKEHASTKSFTIYF